MIIFQSKNVSKLIDTSWIWMLKKKKIMMHKKQEKRNYVYSFINYIKLSKGFQEL